MIADIVKRVRLGASTCFGRIIIGGRGVYTGDYARNNIVDVGKVTVHIAIVEYRNGYSGQDFLREHPQHHIRAAPRTVHSKEAETRQRNTVEMGVGLAHQLVRFLGCGVERYGMIRAVFD